MSTDSKNAIHRIRPFATKSALVRRYAVSVRLTKDGASDIHARQPFRLSEEDTVNHRWWTPDTAKALMTIHDFPGIVHSLTRPFEINITLADAYDWDEVHDDIIAALKSALFPEGAEVTVEAIRAIDRSIGNSSTGAQTVPTPAELAARQALKFKRKIDTSLGVCFAWRDSGGSWFDIDNICSSALADVRAQLECEGWATSLERLSQKPQGKLLLVIRPGDSSESGMHRLQSALYDKSHASPANELWDEPKLRLYTEIRNRQFSERLESMMDVDFPGPFIIPICDASAKHLDYVSENLGGAGWKTHQQPLKVDGLYQPCLVVSSLSPL